MRAGLRWTKILLAGALLLAAAPVLAQAVPDTTSNTPATDAVGPRELQNFSLPGTTTRPADQPATTAPAARNPPSGDGSRAEQSAPAAVSTRTVAARQPAHQPAPAPSQPASAMQPPEASVASPTPSLPATAAPLPQPSFAAPAPVPAPETTTATLTPGHRIPLLPWLIAALVLAAGAIFILWRRTHQRQAFAGAPEYDLFVAPEPTPAAPPRAPAPAPTPALRAAAPVPQPVPQPAPPAPAARPSGIVASRLRPSIELEMQPLRCTFDDEQVTIEFEVELFNSGTAPARAVIAEASLFNASAVQEQELAAFYARIPGTGDRIDSIPPMRRMSFTNRVVAPRAAIQEYELAGRKAFVPVLAFNAQYEWSGGKGQSSLAYLLGRETRSDKLGPLHLDDARREVRGLGARVLPTAVRT